MGNEEHARLAGASVFLANIVCHDMLCRHSAALLQRPQIFENLLSDAGTGNGRNHSSVDPWTVTAGLSLCVSQVCQFFQL